MNEKIMHSVTIQFPTKELAEWFAKMATISVAMQNRLTGATAGIMQDSLCKAVSVGQPTPVPAQPRETPTS